MEKVVVLIAAFAVMVAGLSTLYYFEYVRANPWEIIKGVPELIDVWSPDVRNGSLGKEFTCHGLGLSPEIRWSGVPSKAESISVLMLSVEGLRGSKVNWLVYGVPPNSTGLPKGLGRGVRGTYWMQGVNDYGTVGYSSPCPKEGEVREYVVLVLALKEEVKLGPGASKVELLDALRDEVIAYGKLTFNCTAGTTYG